MDKFKSIAEDVKSGWEKFDKKKRIQLISLVVAIAILLFGIVYYTSRTEYKVLFSELEESDAGLIVEDLEAKGMEYQLENNGTTILIDKNLVDEYRINIAVDGPMPSTNTGFEIFDTSSMMATDDDRAIMYQRAISGELERAITSIDSVKSAKVLLNIPENSVFQNPEYQKDATASIVLETRGSQMPSAATVQGIAALVSGAIDNLPQENVEIVDTNGNLLSTSFGSNGSMNTDVVSTHQNLKKMIETDLEEQVLSLLAPVFGRDKVHISVNTDLNFDAIEREVVEYGDGQYIRSQSESVTGNAALADRVQSGPLDDNTVAVVGDEEDEDTSHYEHATNFEIDSTTSRIVEAPGAINRITASVIIMDNPPNQGAIQGLVENALGINPFRNPDDVAGDSVQIEYVIPSTDNQDAVIIGDSDFVKAITEWVTGNLWVIGAGIVVLIILIALFRMIMRRRDDEDDIEEEDEFDLEQARMLEALKVEEEPVFDAEAEERLRLSELANEKEDLVREQTKQNPELAAELIKIWLQDEDK